MSRAADAESASLARVRADAARRGLTIELVRLDEGTRTAAEAARAVHPPRNSGTARVSVTRLTRVAVSTRTSRLTIQTVSGLAS